MTEPRGGAGPQPDWAEREAARIQNMPHFTKERQLAAFVRALRRAEKRGIIWAYNHYEQAELFVSGERSWRAKG